MGGLCLLPCSFLGGLFCGLLVRLGLGLHGGVHLVDGRLERTNSIPPGLCLVTLGLLGLSDGLLQSLAGGVVRHLPVAVAQQPGGLFLLRI